MKIGGRIHALNTEIIRLSFEEPENHVSKITLLNVSIYNILSK
jgi:hypothetical protein